MPGTAFKNILDFKWVNASLNPMYDQKVNRIESMLPSPKEIL